MIRFSVNGDFIETSLDPATPLLWLLRDNLGLTGTKYGCGIGACGACTVHVNGKAVRACATPVSAVAGARITTIEDVHFYPLGKRVQQAWIDADVVQCGYCQPGQIMAVVALLAENKNPSDADIDTALNGNLCRCGTYQRVKEAVKLAAAGIKKGV
jgi:isoquinoline 1-oxidoreductase alpha subunit